MTSVITYEQAKKITGGRTPLVPVVYEEAVKALAACIDLDDAKTWSDRSDALAAWAKIYRDDKVGRQAKQLKLHAYRRMGQLAHELRPKRETIFGKDRRILGGGKGSKSLLVESGLSEIQARNARRMACLTDSEFDKEISREKVLSPLHASIPAIGKLSGSSSANSASASWRMVFGAFGNLSSAKSFMRQNSAFHLASGLKEDEKIPLIKNAQEMTSWLEEIISACSSKTK